MTNDKTPRFNEVLRKYYDNLKLDDRGGQKRTCRVSGEKFYISAEDIAFYKKIGVPLPTLSPAERMRRKMAFINIENLFYVVSAKTGQKLISSYPDKANCLVWEHKLWNEANFTDINLDYQADKPFFSLFQQLLGKVPRPNLFIKNCVRSDFTNFAFDLKDCYLSFDALESENCHYCEYLDGAKQCYNSFGQVKSEIGYENILVDNSYKVFFSERCDHCLDSAFLFDCRDCQNCFMSINLRHKQYVFRNQQLTKEEYERKMKEIDLGSRRQVEEYKKEYQEMKKKNIRRANYNFKTINCLGDNLQNCKDCKLVFYSEDSENLAYSVGVASGKDLYDSFISWPRAELSYEIVYSVGPVYNVKFSILPTNLQNCEYCDSCKNCSHCFGCIGLKNKRFCIFNKQYTEEEYWRKLDEIKVRMLADGEYGEFFPPKLALIPYNISVATSYGGYDNIEMAKKYGYKVEEIEEPRAGVGLEEIAVDQMPDNIKNISDDILRKVIIDKENNKKFRYTKEELEFHRKYNLVLPTEHYSFNLAQKRISLGPIDFTPRYRKCARCGQETQVTFPEDHPNAPEIVYCSKCYNEKIT